MGGVLQAVTGIASAIIPGVAPIAAAVGTIFPGLMGGSGGGGSTTQAATQGAVHMAVVNGGNGGGSLGPLEAPPIVPGPSGFYGADAPPSAATPLSSIGAAASGLIGTITSSLGALGVPADGVGLGGAIGGAISAIGRAFPAIEAVVPKILLRTSGYAAAAAAIYELYKRLRTTGVPHKSAKRQALAAAGIHLRRRRMRATNVHALRRAIRRVHSFRRIASKVGALHVGRRRLLPMHSGGFRRRRYRRGDVNPFAMEDYADQMDELEDFDMADEAPAYAYE